MRLFGWLRPAAVAPRQVLVPRLEMPQRMLPLESVPALQNGALDAGLSNAREPALTATADLAPRSAYRPRDWSNIDVQGQLLADEAKRAGRKLEMQEPRDHASRLLTWCQDAVAAGGTPAEMTFDDVRWAYLDMCSALGWRVASWVTVGRHFAKLTGGKKYRNVRDPKTGLSTAKERIYRIKTAATLIRRDDRQGRLRLAPSQHQERAAA